MRTKSAQKPPLTPALQRKRRFWRSVITAVLATGVLLLAAFVSTRILFKIESIEILSTEGEPVYSDGQITEAFGSAVGDSLFGFDAEKTQQHMLETLPYLEEVHIQRRLPDKILITVTPAVEQSAVESSAGWAVLSKQCKVLRIEAAPPENLVRVNGAFASAPQPGQTVALTQEDKLPVLQALLAKTEAQGLVPIQEIDLSDMLQISLLYQGRIRIVLGTEHDLDYKLDWAWRMVTPGQTADSLGESEQGTLDVSSRGEDGFGRARWRAGVL